MYKFGKKRHSAAASRVAERTRAWAGGTVVLGSNPVWFMNFFFFLTFGKFLSFLAGFVAGTRSAKFPVPVPGL